MEELKTVRKWFQRGFVCMGMDLKDAFLYVPMRHEVNKFLQGQPSESKAQATRNIMYGFESNLIKAFKYEFYKWDWDEKIHPLILIPKSN